MSIRVCSERVRGLEVRGWRVGQGRFAGLAIGRRPHYALALANSTGTVLLRFSVDSIKHSKHSLTQAAQLAFVWDHTVVWFLSKHLTRTWEICVIMPVIRNAHGQTCALQYERKASLDSEHS